MSLHTVYVLFRFKDDPVNAFYWVSYPCHNMDLIHDSFSRDFHDHCLLARMEHCTYTAIVYEQVFNKCFINHPEISLKQFDLMEDVIAKLVVTKP